MKAVIGFCLIAASVGPAFAADKTPQITGIYSDLRRNAETDDLSGTEIIIVGRAPQYYVLHQFWEGSALPPALVPASIDGNKISFTVPAPSGECGYYEATVTARGLEGFCTIPHPFGDSKGYFFQLPRKKSYWERGQ